MSQPTVLGVGGWYNTQTLCQRVHWTYFWHTLAQLPATIIHILVTQWCLVLIIVIFFIMLFWPHAPPRGVWFKFYWPRIIIWILLTRESESSSEAARSPVTKIRYFGTYIRYLPNNIFRYHFRISTSSSTVELVYSIRIFFETSLKLSRISHAPCLLIKITFR